MIEKTVKEIRAALDNRLYCAYECAGSTRYLW